MTHPSRVRFHDSTGSQYSVEWRGPGFELRRSIRLIAVPARRTGALLTLVVTVEVDDANHGFSVASALQGVDFAQQLKGGGREPAALIDQFTIPVERRQPRHVSPVAPIACTT